MASSDKPDIAPSQVAPNLLAQNTTNPTPQTTNHPTCLNSLSPPRTFSVVPLPSVSTPTPQNGTRRFRFTGQLDLGLSKSVMTVGAHSAPWGKTQCFFEKKFEALVVSAEFRATEGLGLPTWKTLSDRFRKLTADRKIENSHTAGASGIVEVYGERQQLLDDILLEIKEIGEEDRAEKEKKTEEDRRIQRAGENMRDSAMKRQERRKSSLSPGAQDRGSISDHEDIQLLKKDIQTRKDMDAAQLKIQEKRLCIKQKGDQHDAFYQRWTQKIEGRRVKVRERRTELEERRFVAEDLAREQRKETERLHLEERRALFSVHGSMSKKLA